MSNVTDVPVSAPLPAGIIFSMAGNMVPPGNFLACNGQFADRILHADLFALIGEQYSPGNGISTFGIPDFRGQFLRSIDSGLGLDPGRTLGTAQASSTGLGATTPTVIIDSKGHNHTASFAAVGDHNHSMQYFSGSSTNYGYARQGGASAGSDLQSSYNGAHSHTVNSDTVPDHSHMDLIALDSGAPETVPNNIAFSFWVSF